MSKDDIAHEHSTADLITGATPCPPVVWIGGERYLQYGEWLYPVNPHAPIMQLEDFQSKGGQSTKGFYANALRLCAALRSFWGRG